MANEYLKRTPTSTGNRKVFTLSLWFKYTNIGADTIWFLAANPSKDNTTQIFYSPNVGTIFFFDRAGLDPTTEQVGWAYNFRDCGSWYNMLIHVDTTKSNPSDRAKCFVNGKELQRDESKSLVNNSVNTNTPPQNQEFWRLNYANNVHYIGARIDVNFDTVVDAIFSDYFFVDGQALTPDVFGKYDEGKGYISAGTSQATDFKKGQWIPKAPAIIKSVINARGGFGVNGFYLPMNSANNFGADFHTTPNSILKLKENLPQPKAEIDGAGDYTNALRDDPFKQYLIYAQPNVSGGLQNGYGDYSHIIRGSGSPCTLTGGSAGASAIPTISTNQSVFYGSSLYFDGGDTLNVETNNSNYLGQDFTIEFWVWHDSSYPPNQMIFNTTPHTSFGISLNRGGSGETSLYIGNGSVWQTIDFRSGGRLYSQQWNHVVVERYNNAITIYHNGVAQGTTTANMPTGFTSLFRYGTYNNAVGEPVLGYIQDYRVYSGVAKYKGGFDVPRPYTPINFANWRAVPDTTANNFATFNPLVGAGTAANDNVAALSSGNLYYDNANQSWTISSIGVSSGKYYAEFMCINGTLGSNIAVVGDALHGKNNESSYSSSGISYIRLYSPSIRKSYTGSVNESVYAPMNYSSGDIVGVTIDYTNREVKFYKNNNLIFTDNSLSSYSPLDSSYYFTAFRTNDGVNGSNWSDVIANFGQNPTFSGNTTAGTFTDSNGKGLFKYEPPTGFLALCEDNLPTPTIKDPGEHFKTVLYTGSQTPRSIQGLGFQPDLVWLKARSEISSHALYDSVRGPTLGLFSNRTDAEETDTNNLTSFDDNGFSLGTGYSSTGVNGDGRTYVAWCWKAGGPAVTNTDGTITSQVSVNQDAEFSIVSYDGSSNVSDTIGHSLGKTPSFIILKARTKAYYWRVYHKFYGSTATQGLLIGPGAMGMTGSFAHDEHGGIGSVTSTTFGFGTNGTDTLTAVNKSGDKYIAYCWAEIEGFSKFGSYVGNGNADGPFVYCGFKPAFILLKPTNLTDNWLIADNVRSSTNINQTWLYPNSSTTEGIQNGLDFLSNGFKLRNSNGGRNGDGITYIFAAFAESPFQTANAK